MRQLSNQSLHSVFAALKSTYRSIDIRALTLRKLNVDNKYSLECMLLKVRFTKQDPVDLENVYNKLKNDIDPGGLYTNPLKDELLRVHLCSMNITDADRLFDNIREGHLLMEGRDYRIVSHVERISSAEPIWFDSYITSKEYLQYRHLLFWSQRDGFIRAHLDKETEVDIHDFAIASLMDLPSLDIVQANSVVVLFPVYCRSLTTDERERGTTLVNFEVHGSLVDYCRVVASKITGDPKEMVIQMRECKRKSFGDMEVVNIPLSLPVSHSDIVEITALHKTLGSISENRVYGDSILNPPYGQDLLIDVFREFESNIRFSEYLMSNFHETKRVAMQHRLICSSVWLLNMIGYRSIPLGMVNPSDENTSGEVHSCDILACNDVNLLLIDCTSTPPPFDKVDKNRNTNIFLSSKICGRGLTVPVIVCNTFCVSSKESALQANVVVIDKGDIVHLHDLAINKGLRNEASSYLADLISQVGQGDLPSNAEDDIT